MEQQNTNNPTPRRNASLIQFKVMADKMLVRYKPTSVKEWAILMGYQYNYFRARYAVVSRDNPGKVLRQAKMQWIIDYMTQNPDATAYAAALDLDYPTAGALGKFLKQNYDMTFRELRKHILHANPKHDKT